MGFMGMDSIGSSDNTFDFMCEVSEGILKQMKKQVLHYDNEYNTSGYIDVVLTLKTLITKENESYFMFEQWIAFWKELEQIYIQNNKNWDHDDDLQRDFNKLYRFVKKMSKLTEHYA